MLRFTLSRLISAIVVCLLTTLLSFSLLHWIPGDPVITMLGLDAQPEEIESLRSELGLDQPLSTQYWRWLGGIIEGDLGTSVMYRENVSTLIRRRLPITAGIGVLALIVAIVGGVAVGCLSAWKAGSLWDRALSLVTSVGLSVPVFWLGVMGIYVFALELGWLPVQGYTSPHEDWLLAIRKTILPVACLALVPFSALARQTRATMLEVMQQEFVRCARALGTRESRILLGHVLRNSLVPVVTLSGIYLRYVIGGSVIIETVFNIPGTGRMIVQAIFDKDFVVVQACLLVMALVVLAGNLMIDLSYGWLDPRIGRS